MIPTNASKIITDCKTKRDFMREMRLRLRNVSHENRILKMERMLTASVKLIAAGVRTDKWIFKAMKWEGELLDKLQQGKGIR